LACRLIEIFQASDPLSLPSPLVSLSQPKALTAKKNLDEIEAILYTRKIVDKLSPIALNRQ